MAAPRSKSLIVVESPAKAKTISAFLDSRYRVEPSYGHIRDLPQSAKEIPQKFRGKEWARLGVNLEEDFDPIYVVPAEKKKYVDRLKEALEGADSLLLATDEDREGESISWHILQLLNPKNIKVERIVFHEVTPEAIKKALENPRAINQDLVRAQEARRILDRLYGYSLSPLLWKRVRPGLSAGRVQSVAVRLLIDRERERIAFVSSTFWDLRAEFSVAAEGPFVGRLNRVGNQRLAEGKSFSPATGRLWDTTRLHLTEALAKDLEGQLRKTDRWTVNSLEKTPSQQRPSPPFITSTLQQEANRKLRLSSKRTMELAQQLYEGIDLGGERVGLITYMRTDSLTLSERALEDARTVIRDAYGVDYLPAKAIQYRTKAKRAQEAHEAIRPTDMARRPQDIRQFLNADQLRLYELIWKRTIASQMVPADLERTNVEIVVEGNVDGAATPLYFGSTGRRIVFPGFLRAYVEGTDDPEGELGDQETLLPSLALRQNLQANKVAAEGHETKAPYRYTEASLVKKLEDEGIGRPSTYASIITTIQDRGYVQKRGNELIPTFTAFCVTELLEKQFSDLVDTQFTARMEDELDEVAGGKRAWQELVRGFYLGEGSRSGLEERVRAGEVFYPSILLGNDPDQGDPVEIKIGKYGAYVRRGEGGTENIVSLPDSMAPDELKLADALGLLRAKKSEKQPLAYHEESGRGIFLQSGRFGEYLELEQTEEEKAAGTKPQRVSLPRELSPDQVTPEIARLLIRLPRHLGTGQDGEVIQTGIGKFGPFVRQGNEFRSLGSWMDACSLTLEGALDLLAQPKPQRGRSVTSKTVFKEFEPVEGFSGPLKVLDGRYGPYVSDGETHASLPKNLKPEDLSLDEAVALLEARRQSAPAKKAKTKKAGTPKAPKAKNTMGTSGKATTSTKKSSEKKATSVGKPR